MLHVLLHITSAEYVAHSVMEQSQSVLELNLITGDFSFPNGKFSHLTIDHIIIRVTFSLRVNLYSFISNLVLCY